MTTPKWAAEWTAAGGWLVYLGTKPGALHDVKLAPEREADAKLAASARDLRDALASVSDMLFERPDMVAELRPLMGPAEHAVFDAAAAALARARGEP